MRMFQAIVCSSAVLTGLASCARAEDADLIVLNARVITVDKKFSIHQALAVRDGGIVAVGTDGEVRAQAGPSTRVIDLGGKTVLPGLIDSHTHPLGACLTEFDHPVPDMQTVDDVLAYIRQRARTLGSGKWIVVRQVFITRLKEQRYPTRGELDRAAPENPVLFATGPDASVNSLALQLSGIGADFKPDGPGRVEKDPQTGEPTGILRNLTRYIPVVDPQRTPTRAEKSERLLALFRDYNAHGITAIIDRSASDEAIELYRQLRDDGKLTVRLGVSRHVPTDGPLDTIRAEIDRVAQHPLRQGDSMLRIIGIKTFLDGGMLTGSAYMLDPWGKSTTYAIDDPSYRGVLFIPPEKLVPMVRATVEAGMQFTAHSVGDGAVQALLSAYEEVGRSLPIARTRPCLTHANFMTTAQIAQAAHLGVVVDMQPAWLALDTRTLFPQFGAERLRRFQPLRALFDAGVIVGGGSDHMQKIGAMRAINPYEPFWGMWVAHTRLARDHQGPLNLDQRLTRAEAIQFYTRNNAWLLFLEDKVGSLEVGKRADFIVVDRDPLTCPADELRNASVLSTYLGGQQVYSR